MPNIKHPRPSYKAWNQALADYFTENTPVGSPVYLAVNPEVIAEIAEELSASPAFFYTTVRGFVLEGDALDLSYLVRQKYSDTQAPLGVAWLCLQTLAAAAMHADEAQSLSNYYIHLRSYLELPGKGAPKGLDYIDLETLWLQWNRWLSARGFQSTAQRGLTQSTKYIAYPLSQCLLRDGEGHQLQELWYSEGVPENWSRSQLRQWFQKLRRHQVNRRLFEILNQGQRPEVYPAIFQLYLEGEWQKGKSPSAQKSARVIEAGLYRYENFISDAIHYFPLPRQRGKQPSGQSWVLLKQDKTLELEGLRPGWFRPLSEPVQILQSRHEWQVQGGYSHKIVMPGANVWALVPDPDNPEGGAYATWQRPQGDYPFLLLAHGRVRSQIKAAVDLGVLTYRKTHIAENLNDWHEYLDCCLLPAAASVWQTLKQQAPEVWECLVPETPHHIYCRGGLRGDSQGQRGWLSTHPPEVSLSSDLSGVILTLKQSMGVSEKMCWQGDLADFGTEHWQGPGQYLLQATLPEGQICEKIVYLWDWEALSLALPRESFVYSLENGATMQGGILNDPPQ